MCFGDAINTVPAATNFVVGCTIYIEVCIVFAEDIDVSIVTIEANIGAIGRNIDIVVIVVGVNISHVIDFAINSFFAVVVDIEVIVYAVYLI